MTPATPGTPPRPLRADARRNRERLLAEADAAFTEHGTDASLEEIARRAGVGIGTLYRHFPTREALLEALLHQAFEGLRALAADLLTSAPPDEALVTWLRALLRHATTYSGLAHALVTTLQDETSALYASCHAVQTAGAATLTRAQTAGTARPDLTAADLFLMTSAIGWLDEQTPTAPDPGRADRLLTLLLEGVWSRGGAGGGS
ncbi:TetR/AcrR family transcriptional regulator [Allostreptomyces psammosilenae]|uniref:AcrR family transcriptional regulator n=1 Tax=Allostreptomyces psammosilenae TaxID=1892865 RepID=A0A852ZXT3_9ACTN|nr:TetR/AcrR family transcriptional regulator [Allostreptomyces psammosilenae]NYI06845.1 AcrR family transcriptional regulator [Allostreptomyces psammosilenae]